MALVLIASLLPIALPASADEVVVRSGLVDIVDVRNVNGQVRVDTLHNGSRHPVGEVIVAAGPNSRTRFTRQMLDVLDRNTFDVEKPGNWAVLDEHHEIWRKRVGRDVWVIPATPTAGLPRIGFSTMNFSPHIDDWRTQLYRIDGPGDVPAASRARGRPSSPTSPETAPTPRASQRSPPWASPGAATHPKTTSSAPAKH